MTVTDNSNPTISNFDVGALTAGAVQTMAGAAVEKNYFGANQYYGAKNVAAGAFENIKGPVSATAAVMGDALTKGLTAAAVAKTGYDVYQEPTPSGKVAVVVDAGVGYGVATGLGYGAFVATGWGAAALGVGAVVGFGYSVASNYFGWKVTYQDAIISSGKNLADMAKGDTPLSGIGSANAGIGSMAQTGTNGMPSPRSMTPNQFHDMLYGGGYAQPSPPTTPHVNTNGGVSGGQGIAPFNSSHPPTGSGGTNFSHVTSNPPSHPTAGGGTNFSHVTSNPPSHPTAGGGTNFSHVTSNPPSHPTAGGTNFSHVTSNPPSHPTPSHPTPTTTSHPNVHTSNPSTHSSPTHSNNHFGGPHPIVLDLAGTGINISEVTRSNTFIDSDGSGKLHRTAWAGVGSGVLFFDPSGTGAITQKNQYVFTEWDPTAQDDMQALRNAFDSNGDGKLDASDAKFAQFKVMVTNADGTQTAKTLTQLGITSIDLKADTTDITYSDGSAIEGQTTYTKSDGSKGTVAAATLATDAKGYAVVQTTVTDGAGTVTVTSTATDADGSIASVTTSVTTANGSSRTLTYDDNGDGVVDRRQVITKATDGVGTTTELWTNSNGGNIKLSAVQTITSIDGKSITINRDSTGGGWYDQTETRMKAVDGSRIFTITDKNADGSEIRQVATTYSIDGLTKTVSTDLDSNLTADRSVVDTLINNLDGSRSETEITKSNNGTILSKVWTDTSIDGKTQTINEDKNGDGLGDLKTVSAIVKNPDGTSISTINSYSQNGTYIDGKTVTKSADSLSSTTTTDMTGDQVFDRKTVDTMVINADKSRDHNVDVFSGNGTLLSHSRIYLAADQLTKTISVDTDGNGIADYVEQTSRDVPNGNRIITGHYKYDKAGNYINGWSTYTSADGLTVDTYVGHTSNGNVWESSIHDVTVKNADGTSTQSISNYGPQTGVLISKTVIDSSANGLNVTKKTDINADNIFDYSHNDLREVFGDLSTRITVSDYNGNGTLRDQIITNSSADRRTVNITVDANGDGKIDQSESITKANTGIITDLVMSKAINATIINQSQTVTSANGLSVTTSTDIDGNGTWDAVSSTVKSYQIDGNIVVTADNRGGNNTLLNRSTVTTSGNTLTQTVKADVDGNGTFDRITVKNTVLNSDGSGTTNVANQDSTGKITDQQTTTVDRTGLNITTTRDINGDAVTDSTDYDQTTYNANGDIVHIEYTNNANGSLRNKQTTTIFANSKNSDVVIDTNGDGRTNQIQTVRYNADGSTTVAISNYDGNNSLYLGTLQDTTTTTTSGNGLVTKTSWDVDGNGVENRYQLDSLVFNNDGSTTRTVAQHITNGIDITASSNSLTTSGNGLSITTKVDADGNGTTDTTVSDVTQIALDGTRTRTVITTNNDTTVREKQVITLGADQLTKTINFDSDGNGTNELTDLTQTGVDGKVTHTITNYNTTGTKISQFTTVSALNGMSSTWTDDRNGDGLADVLTPSLISIAVDGTQTTTIIDKQQTGATTFLTTDQLTKTESGNGLNITLIEDRNGDGIYELNTTDFTVIGTDAAKTETITVKSNTNIVKDTWANVTSANGLTSSTNVDFNGDGRADFTDTYVMVADSSSTDTKIYKLISTGAVREKIITTLSADHLVTTITEDLNGDGVNDRSRQITDRGDGNVEVLFDDYSQFGTLTNRISLLENANEQYKRVDLGVSLARNGVSLGAVWNTEQISYSATGQTIDTVTYGSPNFGSLITETTTTEANGFNSTTIVDLFGDKVTDETKTYQKVINVDGSTVETFTVKNATAVLVEKDVTTTSANGLRTTLNIDNTGDGLNDRVVDTTKQVDGSVKIINTEFTAGVQSSQLITTVSADKLIVTKAYSNGYSETTTNATHAMGSYNWLASDGTKSAHSYDAAGIDTWTATVGVTNYSAAIDKPSEAEFLAIADRIFDTVLDRDMTDREQETLVKYISDGNLNKTQLINDLLASTEFTTKYKGGNVSGTSVQSQLNLIDQFYLNALGRDPTTYAAVLAKNALYNGTQTLAGLIAKISESSEHIVVGLDHITTNNTVLNLGQLNTIHQTDHTLDSVMANNFVKLLYDALFDRDPTPTELSTYATQLLNGTTAKWDMAQKIMTTGTEFSSKYGAMTNTDFINAIYFNAMGAQPASYEQPTWLSLLNANSIDRAAYVTMIAASIEHDVIGSGRNFTGTAGNDTLTGTDGNDALYGGAGDDLLIAGKGSDLLDGGTGVDTASFASSLGYVYGYVSNTISSSFDGHYSQLLNIENLTGSSFNDTLLGDSNSNTLDGGAGNDYLDGGAGDDTLIGGAGADQMSGGAGLDTASYANSSLGVTVNLNITTAQISNGDASGDTLSGIENLIGSSYNDTLTGDANANTLSGGAGNDILIGGAGADNLNGGAGIDTADYGASTVSVQVNLSILTAQTSTGDASGDLLALVENLTGSAFADTLTGDANANVIDGGAGDDTINGGAGANTLIGGAGNDLFYTGASAEAFDGGSGFDTLYYYTSVAGVNVNLATNVVSGGDAQGDTITGIEYVYGSSIGNNVLIGDVNNNYLAGFAGNDTISGGAGDDTIDAGTGTDLLDGGAGVDILYYWRSTTGVTVNLATNTASGGEATGDTFSNFEGIYGSNTGDDTLVGDANYNVLIGYGGNDWISGGAGADYLDGGIGNDTADYTSSLLGVTVNLNLAAQVSAGDASGDTLLNFESIRGSNTGNDVLYGTTGFNYLFGNGGNDFISGGAGGDYIDGGAGNDTVSFSTSTLGVTVNLNLATAQVSSGDASGVTLIGIENLTGSAFADALTGDINANILIGGDGNDILIGGAGADTLNGGLGVDTADYSGSTSSEHIDLSDPSPQIYAGDANGDVLIGIENIIGSNLGNNITGDSGNNVITGGSGLDFLYGGAGNDFLYGGANNDYLTGGQGGDYIDGGASAYDMAEYTNSSSAVSINLLLGTTSGGDAQGDTLVSIESLTGSNVGSDMLSGDNQDNTIYGLGGDDTINGFAGNDMLFGGAGNDTINAGDGSDQITGGDGADAISGGDGNFDDAIRFTLTSAGITVDLNAGTGLGGEAQGDTYTGIESVYATNSLDVITGNASNNTIQGYAGNDTLSGMGGFDIIYGGDGNDTINGGTGDDYLYGNLGSDTFVFSAGFGKDILWDFAAGTGVVDVMQLSLGTAFDTFAEVMAVATQVGANTVITIDPTDTITLVNVLKTGLVADDFLFV